MEKRNLRKTRTGVVISNKMDKTIVIATKFKEMHPIYGKFVQKTKKYHAHDENNVIRPRDVEELYEALPGKKSFEIVPQSGHNFQTGQNRQDLYKAIAGFLQAE